jgi:hypothetical protein
MVAPTIEPRITMPATGSQLDTGQDTLSRMRKPTGTMTSAATIPRIAPNRIFSTATSGIGSGASSRSSISLVHEKSMISGMVVFCSAPRNPFRATIPGSRMAV